MAKAAILGVGRVGAALAWQLASEGLCGELVLADLDQAKARAEAADLQHALGYTGRRVRVRGGSYYDCADADVCVLSVCAQFPPNTPRLEMLDHAAAVIGRIVPSIMATDFAGVLLVVTDPVDLMTWLAQQLSDLPDSRVLGAGTALDTARLRAALAQTLDLAPAQVDAWVLGQHGGEPVIPWEQAAADGQPLEAALAARAGRSLDRDALCNTIAEVSYNLSEVKGAPVFGIAAAAAEIVRRILTGDRRPIPVSAMLHGEYGHRDVYVGVPAILGPGGVEKIVELPLSAAQQARFDRTVRELKDCLTDIS